MVVEAVGGMEGPSNIDHSDMVLVHADKSDEIGVQSVPGHPQERLCGLVKDERVCQIPSIKLP